MSKYKFGLLDSKVSGTQCIMCCWYGSNHGYYPHCHARNSPKSLLRLVRACRKVLKNRKSNQYVQRSCIRPGQATGTSEWLTLLSTMIEQDRSSYGSHSEAISFNTEQKSMWHRLDLYYMSVAHKPRSGDDTPKGYNWGEHRMRIINL